MKKQPSKVAHNSQPIFFSVLAWLPKRPILGRNRNFIGSLCLLSTISLENVNKLVSLTLQDIYAVRTSMSKTGYWIDRCRKKEKAFFLSFFSYPLVFVRKRLDAKSLYVNYAVKTQYKLQHSHLRECKVVFSKK